MDEETPPRHIHLSPEEVTYLEGLVREGRTEQRIARRARILLEMADPATIVTELADRLGQDRRTIWALCRRFEALGVDVVKDSYRPGRSRELSPLQRVEVERLACSEPAGVGLHMTHWSTRSLARAARLRGIAPAISHSTVAVILRDAAMQPHRSRYWKTPTPDDAFRHQAARILCTWGPQRRTPHPPHLGWRLQPRRPGDSRLPAQQLPSCPGALHAGLRLLAQSG